MQTRNYFDFIKILCMTLLLAFSLAVKTTQAGQYNYTTPVNSTGNNFTMVSAGNTIIGGTNDVVFTWDGTSQHRLRRFRPQLGLLCLFRSLPGRNAAARRTARLG